MPARHQDMVTSTQCQACDIAKLLPGYQYVYQPAMLYMERLMERKEEGLAIYSRYPILSSDYTLLYRYMGSVYGHTVTPVYSGHPSWLL